MKDAGITEAIIVFIAIAIIVYYFCYLLDYLNKQNFWKVKR